MQSPYMKMLYKYPQNACIRMMTPPTRTRSGSRTEAEYELLDTAAFDENRYFDVSVEYAQADTNDH